MEEQQKQPPVVGIVITAYNVEQYIKKSIESAISQTYPRVTVCVVLDCPTDGTKEIVDVMTDTFRAENYKTLFAIENTENVGAGMSRRNGINHLKDICDYILLLDGDDWLDTDFVETLLNNGEDADIISGGITVHRENGDRDITIYKERTETGINRIKGHFLERIVFLNNKLVRSSLYDQVEYCGRRYIEDTPTIVPLLYLANKVKYVECPGYNYLMRDGSLTHESNAVKNALFRGLCIKELIEWAQDKPREYRDQFRYSTFLQLAKEITKQPKELVKAVCEAYPAEWKEFIDYLQSVEELRDSILKF